LWLVKTGAPPNGLPRATLPAVAVLFVVLSVWLFRLDLELRNEVAVNGIVSFELARTGERAGAILGSWDASAREAALLLQGLDYLYLFVYPALFSLLVRRVAVRLGGAWESVGVGVGRGVLLCAPLDAIENQALIAQLREGASDALARRAWLAATPKFALLFLAVGFLLACGGAILARRFGATGDDDRRGGRAV
jgi:hypothetical protein